MSKEEESTPQGTIFSFFKRKSPPSSGDTVSSSGEKTQGHNRRSKRGKMSLQKNLEEELDSEEFSDHDDNTDSIVNEFEKKLGKMFETFQIEITKHVKDSLKKITDKISVLEGRIEKVEDTLKECRGAPADIVEGLKNEIKQLKIESNRQAQYSRKDTIRIFGVKEKQNENSKEAALEVIVDKMGVTAGAVDLAVAHRLPASGKDKPKPMIVRFYDRDCKAEVMASRKKLKGTRIYVADDMTSENMKLLNRAKRSGKFESVWFANGRVKAAEKSGKRTTLEIFDVF